MKNGLAGKNPNADSSINFDLVFSSKFERSKIQIFYGALIYIGNIITFETLKLSYTL